MDCLLCSAKVCEITNTALDRRNAGRNLSDGQRHNSPRSGAFPVVWYNHSVTLVRTPRLLGMAALVISLLAWPLSYAYCWHATVTRMAVDLRGGAYYFIDHPGATGFTMSVGPFDGAYWEDRMGARPERWKPIRAVQAAGKASMEVFAAWLPPLVIAFFIWPSVRYRRPDAIAKKIAGFERLTPDAHGECPGRVEIIEQLQDAFGDARVVDLFLRLIGDGCEHDMARVAVLKFLELNPPMPAQVRFQVASQLVAALLVERDETVRRWIAIALGGYTDLGPAFTVALARLRDAAEDEDVRFNCLAALKRVGPVEPLIRAYREVAAGSDALASSAHRQLIEWGVASL
jgi:hypothetical protein